MGLRFRKSVKIFPGVRLNFSKSGISITIGPRGASVSIGKRGVYANVGIPGTGISSRTRIDSPPTRNRLNESTSGGGTIYASDAVRLLNSDYESIRDRYEINWTYL
jgi:hypothetical protein